MPFSSRHVPGGISNIFDVLMGLLMLVAIIQLFRKQLPLRSALALVVFPLGIPLLLALHTKGSFSARYLYMPVAGLVIIAVPLLERFYFQIWQRTLMVFALIGLALITLTVELPNWRSQAAWTRLVQRYDPTWETGWQMLADLHIENDEIEAATSVYNQALLHGVAVQNMVSTLENIAYTHATHQRFEQSLKVYRRIAKTAEYAYLGWTGAGNALWALKRYEQALSAYRQAMEDRPEHFESIYNYAMLSEQIERPKQAAWAYRQLLNQDGVEQYPQAIARAKAFLVRYRD